MENKFMKIAIKEAIKAYKSGEVPVGAIIVKNNKVIARAHNLVEKKKNSILHAEMLVITKASKKIKNWRLLDCDMYVTLEPCEMCKNAILNSRIRNVYYSTEKMYQSNKQNNMIQIKDYLLDTTNLIKNFFSKRRKD